MKSFISTFSLFSIYLMGLLNLGAQTNSEILKKELTYFLPNISYKKNITTPEQFFGFQIGEWHVSHDRALAYMELLATESDRMEIHQYAKSHEQRKLVTLYVSSPKNLQNKENIKKAHVDITNNINVDMTNLPLVLYQGYSIHGNEPSGINAAMLVAYYLAAGESPEIDKLLQNCFILFDPCYNPDGVQRFSTWANSHKGNTLISDPATREYNEMWPGGRTNHYWFDLNRDWLLLTHPESKGRVAHYHQWKPNVLTDHHEMGTNSTFFFQPGVPSRINHNTPIKNQELTEEIGTYHAEALDKIGSLYYSKDGFDDFYIGKGSTYPDIHGAVGILFEQGSSRGHYQESVNGVLTFPFTIRNQVTASLSTQKACVTMKDKLMGFKKEFYANAYAEAQKSEKKGYLLFDQDEAKLNQLLEILAIHEIKYYDSKSDISINGKMYPSKKSKVIPYEQSQYKLIKASFEKIRSFQDSIFYDVSAWTLPLAYDVQYDEIGKVEFDKIWDSNSKIAKVNIQKFVPLVEDKVYAYGINWNQAFAPTVLNNLLDQKIIVKSITSDIKTPERNMNAGTLIIPTINQPIASSELNKILNSLREKYNVDIFTLKSGVGADGLSMGHPSIEAIQNINAFTIIGNGVSPYDAGELWFYFDQRLHEPLTMLDKKDLNKLDLNRYNTLVLVDGNYGDLSESFIKKLEEWIKKGNNVIAMSNSIEFMINNKWIKLKNIKEEGGKSPSTNYAGSANERGAKVVGGSIFNTELDLTNPLCFGIADNQLALFKQGENIYQITDNRLASPIKYTASNTILSGYIPSGFDKKLANTTAASVHALGNGNITCFVDNVLFRGYWWGGFKVFANALFFSDHISGIAKQGE
jgi:hypothetical protein